MRPHIWTCLDYTCVVYCSHVSLQLILHFINSQIVNTRPMETETCELGLVLSVRSTQLGYRYSAVPVHIQDRRQYSVHLMYLPSIKRPSQVALYGAHMS